MTPSEREGKHLSYFEGVLFSSNPISFPLWGREARVAGGPPDRCPAGADEAATKTSLPFLGRCPAGADEVANSYTAMSLIASSAHQY